MSGEIFRHNLSRFSVSKTNWLHVDIFRDFFINDVNTLTFSNTVDHFLEVFDIHRLSLKLNWFISSKRLLNPFIGMRVLEY